MTTLEKAAKAMFEQVRARAKIVGLILGPETQWEELPDWARKEYADQARVALEALKGSSVLTHAYKKMESRDDNWNNALDTILNEKEA